MSWFGPLLAGGAQQQASSTNTFTYTPTGGIVFAGDGITLLVSAPIIVNLVMAPMRPPRTGRF